MEEDALYQLACECEETLHQIQDTLAHPEALPSDRQLCTELQERFAIWAAYIGVFARKSQCLDRRLRKLPDLQVIAAQLLNILRQTLQRSLETFQKRHASSNDGSEPQDPEATDTGGLGAVDGILTRLNYLSINIRRCSRPVMDDRLYKVAEQHDVDSFASLCTSAVEILYPKAHQSLQTVLADSMKNRFVRILYGSSRNEKLRTRREEQDRRNRESKPSVPALVPRPATTQPLLSANAARPPPFPRDLAPSTSAASQSDLSRLDMRRFQAQRLLDMPAPSAPTTVSLQQRDISYPKKPDPDGSSNYTTCPWCSEEINSQMSDKEWQRHVRQDLKPYVCLWERCPSDERTFAKFSQWVYHMEQHNRQWYRKVFLVAAWICPLCQVPNEPWPNPEALLAHLNNVHPGVFPESSVEAVSRHSRTEQPRPWNQCLICSCIHEGETAGDSHAELDLRKRGKDQLSTDERAKRVRNASGDGKPGQSSASELSDLSDLDSDDESVFAQRKLQTQERSEIMAKHVATHLEMLMSLTLRFKELRNAENTLEYDAWSDRPEFSHSLDSKERAERDLLSDIDQPFEAVPGEDETGSQYGHSEFVKVQETEQAAKLDLDESFQMPVPDAEVDFTDVTRHFDTMSADDARHRAMIESGAFQVAIEEPESPTQSSDRDSLFEKLDAPQGLMTLYEDPERVDFDIIAIPGMDNLNPLNSWKHPDTDAVWLRDFLPQDVPHTRILLWGYSALFPVEPFPYTIDDVGLSLLGDIMASRTKNPHRPIIFICHGLGGLVVKSALCCAAIGNLSADGYPNGDDTFGPLARATYGLLLFGVPGLGMQLGQLEALVEGVPNSTLQQGLVGLGHDMSAPLQDILEQKLRSYSTLSYATICFYEGRLGEVGQIFVSLVVSKESAISARAGLKGPIEGDVFFDTDHSGLVRYASRDDEHYRTVVDFLQQFVQSAKISTPEILDVISDEDKDTPRETQAADAALWMEILAFPWMGSREREINDPYKGTCQWLPKHPKFDQWTRQDRGMLWLRGAPGCGKSTLTKYVRHISSRPFGPDALALSFFFNSAGDDLETSSAGLYRTLLYQVLQTHPDAAPNLCHHTRSFGNREDMVTGDFTRMLALEFKASIARILQEKPVVILIDALDECREAAAPLVRYFRGLLRETLPPVHPLGVLISSRLDPPLGSGLGDSTIAISPGDTVDDIMAYFIGALRSQPYFHPVDRSFILESFRGCFRAASLLVHREKMDSERRWPPTVSPSYVYSEYVGIMKGAPSGDDTRKLAEWLCCATAPLSVRQLQLAMSLDPVAIWGSLQEVRDLNDSMTSQAMDDKLSALGCGLVDIIPSDNRRIVHFIDAEFKDYLASGGLAKLSDHAPSQTREDAVAQVHSRLGRICFKYFRMTVQAITGPVEQPLGEQHVARFPLVEYATLSWPTHMSLGQDAEPAHDQLVDWLDEPLVKVWISRYNQLVSRNGHGEQIPMGTSILHLLAMFGLYYMTHRVLDRPGGNTLAQVNIQDAQGRTPLFSAAAAGHGRVVEMLLDYGAEVDWKDEQGQSPLFEAARKGRTETVRILLDRGADVNLRDSDYESPLLVAAENGHGAIVQLLLEREATTDSDGVSFPRPLAAAVEKNHEHVVDILIAYGADLNSKYAPALVIAAMWGREAVARLLIEHGADVDSKGFRGDSPLGIAAAYGHGTVASLLIDNGAQLNAEDTDRTPPIIQAAQNGHRGIVSLLIACGADLQVEDYPGGRTLLAIAATDGDLVNARLLIEHGADVLATDDGGVSALSRAVKHGHEEIVRLLLDSGADTNSEDDESRSALAYAAANNDEAVMRQLLERGAGMGSEDARLLGHSPLAMAVRANHETAVRLLLGHGADPNEGINELPSMLSMAAHGGHLEVAKLLISHEADVDEGGPYGRQPLVAAASSGHDDMIKLLINHGAQLQPAKPSSSHARSALMKAAAKGHVSTVKLLLDKGAHVNWWDADDGTALSQAVQNQQLDVVRTLLDGGADPDPPTSRSYSPLAIAARLGLMDIVQLLLDHGDDPRKKDMYGRTPIDIATSHGHEEVARLMAQRKPKGMPLSRSRRRDSYG